MPTNIESIYMQELANRAIVLNYNAADTLLIKRNIAGKEYDPLIIGSGLTLSGAEGSKTLASDFDPNAYVKLQATTPGTQQTGHLNISGTGVFGTSVNVSTGGAYKYNSVPVIQAITAKNAYFALGAGNLTGTGTYNLGVGFEAMKSITSAALNTGIGISALSGLTTGVANTAVGWYALQGTTTQNENTAIGDRAAYAVTGMGNIAIGGRTMYGHTSGDYNTVIGTTSLYTGTGSRNVVIGAASFNNATTASGNCVIGSDSALALSSGNFNALIGTGAMKFLTTGEGNTALGFDAGAFYSTNQTVRTNSNGVYIGKNCQSAGDGLYKETVIGAHAIGHGSNTTTIGDALNTDNYFNGAIHLAESTLDVSPAAGQIEQNDDQFYFTVDRGNGAVRSRIQPLERVCTIVTANYTMDGTESVVVANSADPLTVYLPLATGSHLVYEFKNMGVGTMTIEANAVPTADLIDASSSKTVEQYSAYRMLDCSVNQWLIMSYYTTPVAPVSDGFLLKEDGSYLLLETGDKIKLESSGESGGVGSTILQDTY